MLIGALKIAFTPGPRGSRPDTGYKVVLRFLEKGDTNENITGLRRPYRRQ